MKLISLYLHTSKSDIIFGNICFFILFFIVKSFYICIFNKRWSSILSINNGLFTNAFLRLITVFIKFCLCIMLYWATLIKWKFFFFVDLITERSWFFIFKLLFSRIEFLKYVCLFIICWIFCLIVVDIFFL